jgi:hypothetical protein
MARGRTGERYILSTVNIAYAQLGEEVARVLKCAPPRFRVPAVPLYAAGAVNSVLNRLRRDPMSCDALTLSTVPLLLRRVFYDQSKSINELGVWQTPLPDAIAEVAAWLAHKRRALHIAAPSGIDPGGRPCPEM